MAKIITLRERKNAINRLINLTQTYLKTEKNAAREQVRIYAMEPKNILQNNISQFNVIHSHEKTHKMWASCHLITRLIQKQPKHLVSWFFTPVDSKIVSDYYQRIKNPMDLGTISQKIVNRRYTCPLEFRDDMRLVWNNCRIYNAEGSLVRLAGDQISEYFEDRWECCGIEEQLAEKIAKEAWQGISFRPSELVTSLKLSENNLLQVQNRMNTARMDVDYERDMSFEEKRNLSRELGSLPGDCMISVIEIVIRGLTESQITQARTTPKLVVNMDTIDRKTLWELDGLVRKQIIDK